ncbi:MAG: FecR domain-containing protein [Sphingobacterium sp.]
MEPDYLALLIKKLFEEKISDEEKAELTAWVEEHPNRRSFIENLHASDRLFEQALEWIELEQSDADHWPDRLAHDTLRKLKANHHLTPLSDRRKIVRRYGAVAASIVLLGMIFLFWMNSEKSVRRDSESISLQEVPPGRYQASLILPGGDQVTLQRGRELLILDKDGMIRYADGTPVASMPALDQDSERQLIIRVPKAGHYRLQLADSSQVWLNANSELRIPSTFATSNRVVSLRGEAYFDVATTTVGVNKIPFWVRTNGQTIEVTGTEFNVSAFPEDGFTKTTLVEGQVQVHSGGAMVSLKEGEQSSFSPSGLSKQEVDVASHIAWKDNKFYFEETPLEIAMRQLGRWYDVDIEYGQQIPKTDFYGEFNRNQPLDSVLAILAEAGIRFQFSSREGKNRLRVLPSISKE